MNTPTIDEWIAAMDFTPRHDEVEFDHDIPNAHDDSAYTPKELEAAYEKMNASNVQQFSEMTDEKLNAMLDALNGISHG